MSDFYEEVMRRAIEWNYLEWCIPHHIKTYGEPVVRLWLDARYVDKVTWAHEVLLIDDMAFVKHEWGPGQQPTNYCVDICADYLDDAAFALESSPADRGLTQEQIEHILNACHQQDVDLMSRRECAYLLEVLVFGEVVSK